MAGIRFDSLAFLHLAPGADSFRVWSMCILGIWVDGLAWKNNIGSQQAEDVHDCKGRHLEVILRYRFISIRPRTSLENLSHNLSRLSLTLQELRSEHLAEPFAECFPDPSERPHNTSINECSMQANSQEDTA